MPASALGYALVDGLADYLNDGLVFVVLVAQIGFHLADLVVVVEELDGLFEADGDAEADDDGGDVDEEVAPGVGGVVGRGGRRAWGRVLGRGEVGAVPGCSLVAAGWGLVGA